MVTSDREFTRPISMRCPLTGAAMSCSTGPVTVPARPFRRRDPSISASEAVFIDAHGPGAFMDLLAAVNPDLNDLQRAPVIG